VDIFNAFKKLVHKSLNLWYGKFDFIYLRDRVNHVAYTQRLNIHHPSVENYYVLYSLHDLCLRL
jgi:hypothetical protein